MERAKSYLPLLGRILIGAPFILSSIGKLATHKTMEWRIALVTEIVGGALLLIGYRTQLVAAVLAGLALAMAFFLRGDLADQSQLNIFVANIMLAGGLLQIVYFGAGPLSLDAFRGRLWSKWTGGVTGNRVDFTTL